MSLINKIKNKNTGNNTNKDDAINQHPAANSLSNKRIPSNGENDSFSNTDPSVYIGRDSDFHNVTTLLSEDETVIIDNKTSGGSSVENKDNVPYPKGKEFIEKFGIPTESQTDSDTNKCDSFVLHLGTGGVGTAYLIDSENVGSSWLELVDSLTKDDIIYVFYTNTPNTPKISYADIASIMQCDLFGKLRKNVQFVPCANGKNAVDIQMCVIYGFLISTAQYEHIHIVSHDTAFRYAIHMGNNLV